MRIRRTGRKAARVHGLCLRNRSKPRKSSSYRKDTRTNRHQRRATAHRKTRSPESFHQQTRRTHATLHQLLRKGEKFEWTEEARKAFADLKKTLSTPPILAVPKEGEKLYLYVAARNSVVSTALVVE